MFLVFLVIVIIALLWYTQQIYSKFKKAGVKHFKPVPLVGNLWRVITGRQHISSQNDALYYTFKDERFVGRYEFTKPAVIIRDRDLIKNITLKDFEHFLDHRALVDKTMDPLFGRNLFSLRGQEWKEMRSNLSPAFTSLKIRSMVPFMVEASDVMARSLKKKIKDSQVDYIDVDCVELTTRYANDVIASCAFGIKVDSHTDLNNEFYTIGKQTGVGAFRAIWVFFGYTAFPWLMQALGVRLVSNTVGNFFRNIVLSTMKDREQKNIVRPDMIHLLMEAKKGKLTYDEVAKESGAGFATVEESQVGQMKVARDWSDDDLVAQAVQFFIGGFETVATAMSFVLYELACNPEVQDCLFQEIKEHENKNNRRIDFNSIQSMNYLDMVVSETLRKWPPATVLDRLCVKDYNLGKPNSQSNQDYIIRKGEYLIVPTWTFHHNPEFFPNPYKFDPERFSEENKKEIKPFTYIPFGLGPRNCIGSRFALCEVKVMVYQLLLQMEISPCPKTPIPAVLATNTFNLNIQGGNWLRFKFRQ